MTNYHYKKNPQGETVETWECISDATELCVGEWLFYCDDRYFGRVTSITPLRLKIQNFRVDNAAYEAHISSYDKVLRPIENILIDEQIAQDFPQLYQSLEKSFRIWKKIESYILDAPKEDRQSLTPEIFLQGGYAFGKWSSQGYLNRHDIAFLEHQQFCSLVAKCISQQQAIDNESDEMLEEMDRLLMMKYAEACTEGIVRKWLIAQSGFFFKA